MESADMSDNETWRNLSLEQAGVAVKGRTVCAEMGISTLGQLADADVNDFDNIPRFGRASQTNLVEALAAAMAGRPLKATKTFGELARAKLSNPDAASPSLSDAPVPADPDEPAEPADPAVPVAPPTPVTPAPVPVQAAA